MVALIHKVNSVEKKAITNGEKDKALAQSFFPKKPHETMQEDPPEYAP